jgi:hypothetical protein
MENQYLHDEELFGWLMAWSFLMIVGGFVAGIICSFYLL